MFLFNKKSIGINVADLTIEVVELVKSRGEINILSQGRIKLKPGIVQRGRIKDEEKLKKAVKEVLAQAKPFPINTKPRTAFDKLWGKKIIFSLPESQVYTHIFELKKHQKDERDKLVLKEARSSIPLEKDDLLFSYKALNESKDKVEILLVAASRRTALEWQNFFQKLKIDAEFFDIETLANFRGCFSKIPPEPVCLIDIGAMTTNIAIFDKKGLHYSYSVDIAGNSFTKEIAKALKVKIEEAEKMKIKLGLANPGEKIFSILIQALELILKEIEIAFKYFRKKTNQEVKEIILLGGSSKLKKLVDYFKTNLDLSVRLGESKLLPEKTSLEFITATGLALRGLANQWSKKDPVIYLLTEKQASRKVSQEKEKVESADKSGRELLLPSSSELDYSKKLRSQIISLIIILIIGVMALALAYWYRDHNRERREAQLKSQFKDYLKTQSIDLTVPVAAEAAEYTSSRVRGRIIEDIISEEEYLEEAVDQSRIAVEKKLQGGEELWLEPINELPKEEEVTFPLLIKWLVYSEKDISKFFLQELDKLNKNKVDYILSNIEKNNLKLTENPNIFYLEGTVTISLNQLIEVEEVQEDFLNFEAEAPQGIVEETMEEEALEEEIFKEEAVETIDLIIIKDTETGWLNVREGPGTNYSILTKVYLGEIYPLIEEFSGWHKIELEDGQEGWISSQYSAKQ